MRERGAARCGIASVTVAAMLAGPGCSSAPSPTAAEKRELDAAGARFQRCVTTWDPGARGVSATATVALARAMLVACRAEWQALERVAIATLGEGAGEEHLDAAQAWVLRQAQDRALRPGV